MLEVRSPRAFSYPWCQPMHQDMWGAGLQAFQSRNLRCKVCHNWLVPPLQWSASSPFLFLLFLASDCVTCDASQKATYTELDVHQRMSCVALSFFGFGLSISSSAGTGRTLLFNILFCVSWRATNHPINGPYWPIMFCQQLGLSV